MTEISDQVIEFFTAKFDSRYVKLKDCDRIVRDEDSRIDNLTVEFAKSNTKLNIMIAILSTIAVPVVSVCVKMLFG